MAKNSLVCAQPNGRILPDATDRVSSAPRLQRRIGFIRLLVDVKESRNWPV